MTALAGGVADDGEAGWPMKTSGADYVEVMGDYDRAAVAFF